MEIMRCAALKKVTAADVAGRLTAEEHAAAMAKINRDISALKAEADKA